MFSSYLLESYYAFNSLIQKILSAQTKLNDVQKKELRSQLRSLNNKELVSYYNSMMGIPDASQPNEDEGANEQGNAE